jgi:hypothetical protein
MKIMKRRSTGAVTQITIFIPSIRGKTLNLDEYRN